MRRELKFIGYVLGIYTIFIYWALLQERITSKKYVSLDGRELIWVFSFGLNFCMALASYITASVFNLFSKELRDIPITAYCKPALSSCLASPIGYEALKYITYPLMVLTKSSKPVPVMFIGTIFYGKLYNWHKYASVALVCVGIFLFTSAKKSSSTSSLDANSVQEKEDLWISVFGMSLVLLNLCMDGYTNNEQDHVFKHYSASAIDMMKNVNLWQTFFLGLILMAGWLVYGDTSELSNASAMLHSCPALKLDIVLFCLCASFGQVLIFGLMKDFGSLVWIMVSVTRKLFTIIVSVIVYKHSVNSLQWAGVLLVFLGLGLEIAHGYASKPKAGPNAGVRGVAVLERFQPSSLKLRGLRKQKASSMAEEAGVKVGADEGPQTAISIAPRSRSGIGRQRMKE